MTARYPELRTAMLVGSFSPFTVGHLDLLMRGLSMFDRVIVARGRNINKPLPESLQRQDLAALLAPLSPRVEVVEWDGLTVDGARHFGAGVLLRGVRSATDYEYERGMADVNRQLARLETVLLVARPELASVSSSLVRELASFGYDVSSYLPDPDKIKL